MESQSKSSAKPGLIGKFSTQEAAEEVNRRLQEEGISASQSTVESVEADSPTSLSQIKTQGNAGRAALTGGLCGGIIGLIACLIQVRAPESSFLSNDPALITLAVSAAAALVGAIASSLVGVITASKIPTKPLPNSPKVSSHQYLVQVDGDGADLEKATEIIRTSGGLV